MGKAVKVLSIDWDFFIDADMGQRLRMFPDGCDNLNRYLDMFIWGNYYAGYQEELTNIGLREKELGYLQKIIRRIGNDGGAHLLISDSHENIVRMLDSIYGLEGNTKFDIYNIDFHHDAYDSRIVLKDKEIYDCGNWLKYLDVKGVLNKALWVKHADSDTFGRSKKPGRLRMTTDIRDLWKVQKFDVVFLCRSGPWSPPHLDPKFIELADMIMEELEEWIDDVEGVMDSRYTERFLEAAIERKRMEEEAFAQLDSLRELMGE